MSDPTDDTELSTSRKKYLRVLDDTDLSTTSKESFRVRDDKGDTPQTPEVETGRYDGDTWLDEILEPLKRGAGIAQRNEAKAAIIARLDKIAVDMAANYAAQLVRYKKEITTLKARLEAAQANCDAVPDDKPNHVHIKYFNLGYKKGLAHLEYVSGAVYRDLSERIDQLQQGEKERRK